MARMTEAVQAALVGTERKKLKIYDHEFNVKPAQPEKNGNWLVVNGRISHHLTARPGDQVYYIVAIKDAAIVDIKREIAGGGWAGPAGPIISAFGAYFGVPIPPDKIKEIGRALGKVVDGTWETVADIIIANIAMEFQQQELEVRSGTDGMVQGAIREKWLELGGEQGFLGRPLIRETGTPDGVGRYNHFQGGGSIYWTPDTGAHEVHGFVRDKWEELGWERSFLGYPLTDNMATPDGVGRYNHFQGGSIYWTPETGVHEVHGKIYDRWAELGWEQSRLGYPATDEMPLPDGRGRRSGFQRGSIEWTPDGGAREILA